MPNLTLNRWLREKHPEILAEWQKLKTEHKRKLQRDYQREIYKLAKQAKEKQGT